MPSIASVRVFYLMVDILFPKNVRFRMTARSTDRTIGKPLLPRQTKEVSLMCKSAKMIRAERLDKRELIAFS